MKKYLILLILLLTWASMVQAGGLMMVGGGTPTAAATNYTNDANMISYWMMEQATAANATDGAGNNTLTRFSDGSGPTQSADPQQGSYSGDLNVAWVEGWLLADGSLSASFPGKDVGGSQGSFSLGAWIKMDESNARRIMGKSGTGDEESYDIRFDATNFLFRISANGYSFTTITGGTAITDDGSTWYHVAAVFDTDNNLIYLYLNGSSDAVAVSFTGATMLGTSSFMIGTFDGHIDEAFIMSRALSSVEVAEIYAHGLAGDR